jgi:hypothetical protein
MNQGSPYRFYCSGNRFFFDKKITFVFLNFESNTVYRTGNRIPLTSGIGKITGNRRFTGGKVNPAMNYQIALALAR